MSSTNTAQPRLYPAPSAHGNLEWTGLRGWVVRRPLSSFLVITLGLSWLIFLPSTTSFSVPICRWTFRARFDAALVLLPTALSVTSITDGRTGVRTLFGRMFRWRFGISWRLVVLFGLPVIALHSA